MKIDEVNHHYIANGKGNGSYRYIGRAKTADKWPLLVLTKYRMPCLLYKQNIGKQIYGDVLCTCDKLRDHLDYMESLPGFFKYDRYEIPVLLDDGTVHMAWTYFISDFKQELLELDTIDNYNSEQQGYVKDCEFDISMDYNPSDDIAGRLNNISGL
ncbi:putative gamma-glutamylcyclotransferase CG2811 [Oppia nitens]|uniref:putative gamma-glutamylcyclotransferase CG2811 n=1 Tax=Oppia nitens TaxID=1686743 RepID=UPI0023DCCCF3|nr:putative gamma-glutamylcyclotransferase CG2811 [Oppia nitens]